MASSRLILPAFWHYLILFIATVAFSSGIAAGSVPLSTTLHPTLHQNADKTSTPGTQVPILSDVAGNIAKTAAPAIVDAPTGGPTTSLPEPLFSSATTSSPNATVPKTVAEQMNLFLAPICEQLDKIVPKQAFKVQSQFKQIIERTNGKLSICFMKHYKIDPSLNPISKANMMALCHSKANNQPDNKWKAFLGCASTNWDPAAEKELVRIIKAREEHVKNHKHDSKDEPGAPSLLHGDDEVATMINDVVAKAFADGKNDQNLRSDIKLIDLSDRTAPPTLSPVKQSVASEGSSSSAPSVAKSATSEPKIMSDPNTLMVLVDDSTTKTPLTTTAPHHLTSSFGLTKHSTARPHLDDKAKSKERAPSHEADIAKASAHTTSKPHLEVGQVTTTPHSIIIETTTQHPSSKLRSSHKSQDADKNATTIAPVTKNGTSLELRMHLDNTSVHHKNTTKTTSETNLIQSTSTKPTTASPKSNATSASPKTASKGPSEKPLETLSAVLKKQETEKQELDKRLKSERESLMKKLKKKQDEIDAHNAILGLQSERQQAGHHSTGHDNRLHQIEHERQMAIDPIGHTIKHQQHELKKQRLMQNNG